jgi:DNA modification methylase
MRPDGQASVSVHLIRADARALPLGSNTVDLVITSPPYYKVRSYQDGGEHYAGQLGDERTPTEFVNALITATAEMVRVLKPTGSIWINLGDKYSTYAGNRSSGRSSLQGSTDRSRPVVERLHGLDGGGEVRAKSLMGIPWRYAIRCIDDLGLILRQEIIWSKPNGMPESVKDRARRSHEQWFHFTREPRYFAAVDGIREPHVRNWTPGANGGRNNWDRGDHLNVGLTESAPHPFGGLPGSVWTVPTQPLTVPAGLGVDHYAAFPMEWPRRIIKGWSPSGICTGCGEARRPIVNRQTNAEAWSDLPLKPGDIPRLQARPRTADHEADAQASGLSRPGWRKKPPGPATITGESCACPDSNAPTRPAIVLDPFGGTGTTALVADVLGRHGISNDMSGDYCRIARWRTTDPGQRASAMQVERPAGPLQAESLF